MSCKSLFFFVNLCTTDFYIKQITHLFFTSLVLFLISSLLLFFSYHCHQPKNGWDNSANRSSSCIEILQGHYSDKGPKKCDVGYYCTGDTAPPIECPTGYYADAEGSTFCLRCSPGTFSNTEATESCTFCLQGHYRADKNSNGTDMDATKCVLCKSGQFQDSVGSSSCKLCLAGKWSDEEGLINGMQCKTCKLGTYSTVSGLSLSKDCNKCQPGKYSIESGNSKGCRQCEQGQVQSGEGKTFCTKAESNQIVLGNGAASINVPEGSYLTNCSTSSLDSCKLFVSCPAGWMSKELKQSCKRCKPGESSTGGSIQCRIW